MNKQEEYTLMQNSKPYDLVTPIKGGRSIKWLRVWHHKASPTQTSFRTLMGPPYEHKLIKAEKIDLLPVANYQIYKITIKKN